MYCYVFYGSECAAVAGGRLQAVFLMCSGVVASAKLAAVCENVRHYWKVSCRVQVSLLAFPPK